ncbi:MAG: N-acetyltransferase [Thermodesulfobacteriota bacterium]
MNDISGAIIRQSAHGSVTIRSRCSPEEIRTFVFDSQFGTHAHYKSLYTRRESLENNAALPDADVTLALTDNDHIIGFGVLAYPEPGERWARLGPRLMMEVKAIEVSRNWRSAGVAGGILQTMMNRPMIEDKIIYMVGYSWTWDLDDTGRSTQAYRRMLIRLFEPCGFQEYQTNEPNICLKPENLLLGRIGRNVTKEQKDNFKWLRFDMFNTEE